MRQHILILRGGPAGVRSQAVVSAALILSFFYGILLLTEDYKKTTDHYERLECLKITKSTENRFRNSHSYVVQSNGESNLQHYGFKIKKKEQTILPVSCNLYVQYCWVHNPL